MTQLSLATQTVSPSPSALFSWPPLAPFYLLKIVKPTDAFFMCCLSKNRTASQQVYPANWLKLLNPQMILPLKITQNDNYCMYRTLAKIRPPFSARSLGLLGDWAFNRELRVFIRMYAHPRPQIEVYTLLYDNSLCFHIVWTFHWQQQCYKLMHEYD